MNLTLEKLAHSEEDEELLLGESNVVCQENHARSTKSLYGALGFLLSLLICSNTAWYFSLSYGTKHHAWPLGIQVASGLKKIVHTDHLYSSTDRNAADAAWDNYTINGHVALPRSMAIQRGWKIDGARMPGDPDKNIFVVDAFHQMHCLMLIRTMGNDLWDGKPTSSITHSREHINHCYDSLRQGIMCRSDSVPLYVPRYGDSLELGEGQQRECRDWDALERWVVEHTACYNGVKCPS